MPKKTILTILLCIAVPLNCMAINKARDAMYHEAEKGKATVFVSICGDAEKHKATLFYFSGTGEWELHEEEYGDAVNIATFKLVDGNHEGFEALGGVYTYERLGNLIDELIELRFYVLAPFTVEKLRALKPLKDKCQYDH